MESLLGGIQKEGASVVIIDITGVPTVDTGVAHHLLRFQVTVDAGGIAARSDVCARRHIAAGGADAGADWGRTPGIDDAQQPAGRDCVRAHAAR